MDFHVLAITAAMIVLVYVIQYAAAYAEPGFDVPTVITVCVYVIVTEAVFIFENLCALNPHLVNSPMGVIFRHAPKGERPKIRQTLSGERHGYLYWAGILRRAGALRWRPGREPVQNRAEHTRGVPVQPAHADSLQ